jgi:hypothetical protein
LEIAMELTTKHYESDWGTRLVTLGYTSEANYEFGLMGIMRLFFQSQNNNHSANITGVLLFDGVNFAQIIEGSELMVDALWEAIQRDERHKKITLFGKDTIPLRAFSKWTMRVKDGDVIAMMCPELNGLIYNMDMNIGAPAIARATYSSALLVQELVGPIRRSQTLH